MLSKTSKNTYHHVFDQLLFRSDRHIVSHKMLHHSGAGPINSSGNQHRGPFVLQAYFSLSRIIDIQGRTLLNE